MKKFYLLLSAACVAASASAVEKQAVASKNISLGTPVKKVENLATFSKYKEMPQSKAMKAAGTRAGKDYIGYLPGESVWAVGVSEKGWVLPYIVGFGSSYGAVDFYGYSTSDAPMSWSYTQPGDESTYEAEGASLRIKSGLGEMETPVFTVGGESYSAYNDFYLLGGTPSMWIGPDDEGGMFGVTSYQNYGLYNDKDMQAALTGQLCYRPGVKGYNDAGVYVDPQDRHNWQAQIQDRYGEDAKITNLAFENYSLYQPVPQSTYSMTKMWGQIIVEAAADTQLISYIYPVGEDGKVLDTPIALGYASISKGQNVWVNFEYYPLDENGDELEGEVYVDTATIITIEGFAGNDAITSISMPSGWYPFNWNAYEALGNTVIASPTLYQRFSYDVDGVPSYILATDRALWMYDQSGRDQDIVTCMSYHQFSIDAVFAFIHSVDGVEKVTLPKDGGSVDVELVAYWFDIPALVEDGAYEVSAPEWLNVEFSEPSEQQNVMMTVTAEAGEDRTGVVTIEGFGATYSLTVNQGAGNAVESIVLDKNAEYFDLQGRRVANPEKGIYIKKTGNKSEKVIL